MSIIVGKAAQTTHLANMHHLVEEIIGSDAPGIEIQYYDSPSGITLRSNVILFSSKYLHTARNLDGDPDTHLLVLFRWEGLFPRTPKSVKVIRYWFGDGKLRETLRKIVERLKPPE